MKQQSQNNPNRLINSSSPYLLQHAYNPVDWYEWTEEAFEIARLQDKPIFLSIGYSTCHWCHVMAHESFEDQSVADKMNQTFINIKVDREERPDIDGIYMTVCQMLTGSGGWPMTIIMTPDKKPFFGATYIPRDSMYGRIGMLDLVDRINELWSDRRDDVNKSADNITNKLIEIDSGDHRGNLDVDLFRKALSIFDRVFDDKKGGFYQAPKFPIPHNLMYLLRYYHHYDSAKSLEMAIKTLKEMRLGGIWDHIGYGFHRYSTDKKWLLPHFEKMLYDQALLMIAYSEAYSITKEGIFKQTATEIFEYLERDMLSPVGAYYSAEDADSEGEEGKFYVWTADEIRNLLADYADIFMKVYNIKEDGNFIEEVASTKSGSNILHLPIDIPAIAPTIGYSSDELTKIMSDCRKKLFDFRITRIRPHLDDKILTDWNSLAIAALAIAARYLNNSEMLNRAEKISEFINSTMLEQNSLLHRYRNGSVGINAMLDDYSFLAWSQVELYKTTHNVKYLKNAINLSETMILRFWDNEYHGFFFNSEIDKDIISRRKDIYDGAQPSGNSVALMSLLSLEKLTGNTKYKGIAFKLAESFASKVNHSPTNYSFFLSALFILKESTTELVAVGSTQSEEIRILLDNLNAKFLSNTFLLIKDGDELDSIAKFTEGMKMINEQPTLYLCRNFTCESPTVINEENVAKLINLK